jgi:hypothetical protein
MMKQLQRIAISSAASLAFSGCAITAYGPELNTSFTYRDQTIQSHSQDIFPEAKTAALVSTSCSGFIPYTVMVSPIIPLPPIIPVWSKPKPIVEVDIDTTRTEKTEDVAVT